MDFSGEMTILVTLVFDGEEMGKASFPGEFAGYFDEYGMYLEKASVDVSAFYA